MKQNAPQRATTGKASSIKRTTPIMVPNLSKNPVHFGKIRPIEKTPTSVGARIAAVFSRFEISARVVAGLVPATPILRFDSRLAGLHGEGTVVVVSETSRATTPVGIGLQAGYGATAILTGLR